VGVGDAGQIRLGQVIIAGMPITPTVLIEAAKKLAGAVEAILTVKDKLSAKPDLAANALGQVLHEIAKTQVAVDGAISKYLNVPTNKAAFDHGIQPLLDLSGGVLGADIEQARGHCHDIGPIYDTHLRRWFASAVNPTEQLLLENVFTELRDADGGLFRQLGFVADLLENGANEAIVLYKTEGPDAARARMDADSADLMKLRTELSRTRKALHSLQNELKGFVPGNAGN
jgi:hypothetical protein